MRLIQIGFGLVLILSLNSCIKDKITIDENTVIPDLTPSLAIPIAEAHMTLEEADDLSNEEAVSYNPVTGYYEYSLDRNIFSFAANDLLAIEAQLLIDQYQLDDNTINLLNSGSSGDIIAAPPMDLQLNLDLTNGELLDSILVDEGQMSLELSSTIKQNFIVNLTIPALKQNGISYSSSFDIDYPGSVPFDYVIDLNIDGYTLDLTGDGSMNNLITVEAQIFIVHSGEGTEVSEFISGTMDLDIDNFNSVWGYFGQYTGITDVDTNDVNFFDDLNGGTLYLSDPRIELAILNSAGVDVEVDFTSIIAPTAGSEVILSGTDLTEIPIITGASMPGETSITQHVIDNTGTSPTLSEAMDADPDIFIYTASGQTNPTGIADNFILDTSFVRCDAKIILPAFGYADNFTITDSIEADIEEIVLDANSSGDVITYEDITNFTVRLFIQNGLAVTAGVKAYFTDSNYVVLDSVFFQNDYQYIIEAGNVDFSLPPSDPDYGRVSSPTEAITDISFTKERIQYLMDNESTHMIIQAIGFTADSDSQQEIKFFPEDYVRVKVSAKVDFDFDLSE